MTTTSTLPPPLSAPPTVATLQGLLDGLQQPMHRGVPSPPTPPAPTSLFEGPTEPAVSPSPLGEGSVLDLTRLEQLAATGHAAPAARPSVPSAPAAPAAMVPPPVTLTWSAGQVHGHSRRAAVIAMASAAVVTVAALAATMGELTLP